jgi:hypothetical protein
MLKSAPDFGQHYFHLTAFDRQQRNASGLPVMIYLKQEMFWKVGVCQIHNTFLIHHYDC